MKFRSDKWLVDKELLLDYFARAVSDGMFFRLPYETWRRLKRCSAPWFLIEIIGKNEKISIKEATPIVSHNWLKLGQCLYEDHLNIPYQNDFTDFISDNWQDTRMSPAKTLESFSSFYDDTSNDFYNYTFIDKEKENNENMKTDKLFNFEFGPVSNNQFRMSPYGIAVSTANNGWVSYNSKSGEIFDVDILNFDISKLIYKMPVALNGIAAGDIVIHGDKPMFVRSVNADGTISVIDYTNASVSNILPVKSPFGFNFFTKICTLIDFNDTNANADNPFGNFLPFLMFSEDKEIDPSLFFLMGAFKDKNNNFAQNPLVLYALMNQKNKANDMLPFLFLMGDNNPFNFTPPAKDD